jgi:hypothetical protein
MQQSISESAYFLDTVYNVCADHHTPSKLAKSAEAICDPASHVPFTFYYS